MERRSRKLIATGIAALLLRAPGAGARGLAAAEEPRLTDPPAAESPAMKGLIDKASAMLAGGMTTTQVLTDPQLMPAHEYPRFRDAIRSHAPMGRTSIVTPAEAGTPLVVKGVVRSADGSPAKGVLMYVYQTSAKGWYSDRAPHFASGSGDEKHARLFGYPRTDDNGAYEIGTVMPTGYPGSDLPAHIHVEITPGSGKSPQITEIRFESDKRMTPAMRERSKQEGFLVVPVTRDSKGTDRATADLKIR